ncbi:unnamed protein product, partial [Anisakis simplex]|uniref:DM5 domain-containing protein n=1 Tax=Anisakis simplex TaxID=6269 RepID=A0A0M3JAW6_ANISI
PLTACFCPCCTCCCPFKKPAPPPTTPKPKPPPEPTCCGPSVIYLPVGPPEIIQVPVTTYIQRTVAAPEIISITSLSQPAPSPKYITVEVPPSREIQVAPAPERQIITIPAGSSYSIGGGSSMSTAHLSPSLMKTPPSSGYAKGSYQVVYDFLK